MGILGNAIAWVKGLLGSSGTESTDEETVTTADDTTEASVKPSTDQATAPVERTVAESETPTAEPEPVYKCTVCGTEVGADAEQCSLCHSTDLVPIEDAAAEGSDDPPPAQEVRIEDEADSTDAVVDSRPTDDEARPAKQPDDGTNDGLGPDAVKSTRSDGTDASVATERLRQARARGAVLDDHPERWGAVDDGYRVSLPGDVERTVDTKEQVRTLLWNAYGVEGSEPDDRGEKSNEPDEDAEQNDGATSSASEK